MSELNLIPYELKAKREKALRIKKYGSIGIIIFAVFFAINYIPNLYLDKLILKENSLEVEITSNAKVLNENTKILAEIKSYDSYIKEVDALKKHRVNITDKIKNLQKYTPLDVVITSIDYSNGALTLSGTTTSSPSISAFVANLQMSKEYPSARIVSIIDDNSNATATMQSGKYKFTINITQ